MQPRCHQLHVPQRSILTISLQEKAEVDEWKDKDLKGGKAKMEEKEEKRKADLARKAENARLLAEEEASVAAKKAPSKAGKKGGKDFKPAGPGAIAAGGITEAEPSGNGPEPPSEIESYTATGIDNALDLLDVVTAKMDKASVGQQAAGIERHPEVIECCILYRSSKLKIFSYLATFQGNISVSSHCDLYLRNIRLYSRHIKNESCQISDKR